MGFSSGFAGVDGLRGLEWWEEDKEINFAACGKKEKSTSLMLGDLNGNPMEDEDDEVCYCSGFAAARVFPFFGN